MSTWPRDRKSSKSAGTSNDRPLNTDACYTAKSRRSINQLEGLNPPLKYSLTCPKCYDNAHPEGVAITVNGTLNAIDVDTNDTLNRKIAGRASDTWLELGRLYEDRGSAERAIAAFTRALDVAPDDDVCRLRLSGLLYRRGRAVEAIATLAATLSFTPQSFNQFCNFCTWIGAFATLERVIREHDPRLGDLKFRAEIAMAYVWRYRGRPDLEKASFESARNDATRCGQSFFEAQAVEGLRDWDITFGDETAAARALASRVERESPIDAVSAVCAGRARHIRSLDPKEGFNFSQDVALASALAMFEGEANPPTLWVNQRILSLFQRSFPGLTICANAPKETALGLGPEDLHMRELPLIARFRDIARPVPAKAYLKADPERVAAIQARNRRRSGGRPAVGLCWRSSSAVNEGFRSSARLLARNRVDFDTYLTMANQFWRKGIPLPFLEPIISDPNLDVISMQYGLGAWEAERLSAHTTYCSLHLQPVNHFGNMDQVATELAALDAFISPPGGYAHLAAALGVPTLVLLNDQPPIWWIWNERFAIYPDVSLYRKKPIWRDGDMGARKYDGDWALAVANLHRDLSARLSGC